MLFPNKLHILHLSAGSFQLICAHNILSTDKVIDLSCCFSTNCTHYIYLQVVFQLICGYNILSEGKRIDLSRCFSANLRKLYFSTCKIFDLSHCFSTIWEHFICICRKIELSHFACKAVFVSLVTCIALLTGCLTFWHQSFTFNSNKSPTSCNNFSVYCPDVCLQLNMFRAFSRPSSGAQ
jgi:hypothetical protein